MGSFCGILSITNKESYFEGSSTGMVSFGSLLPEPKDTIPVLDPSKYDSLLVMDRMPQKDPMFFEAEDPASFPAQILKGFMVGNYNLRGFTGNKNVLVL